jgi:hypothetical protein
MTAHWAAFYRGHGRFSDHVIRRVTRSPFSHVELIRQAERPLRGETARCISSSLRDGGVRIKDIRLDAPKWDVYALPWAPDDAWNRAEAELGRPYELWPMLFSQLLNLRRHRRDAWHCSELVGHALGLSMPHAKSPGDLLRAVHDHTGIWYSALDRGRTPESRPGSGDGFDPS